MDLAAERKRYSSNINGGIMTHKIDEPKKKIKNTQKYKINNNFKSKEKQVIKKNTNQYQNDDKNKPAD